MHTVLLDLDQTRLPYRYSVTGSDSMVGGLFGFASKTVQAVQAMAPPDATCIEVESSDYEGTFLSYHAHAPTIIDATHETEWWRGQTDLDWVDIREVSTEGDSRAVILHSISQGGDMYFVAATSDEFMQLLMLSLTPSWA